jgi:hypothetical protein
MLGHGETVLFRTEDGHEILLRDWRRIEKTSAP